MKNKKSLRCALGFHKSGKYIYSIPHHRQHGYAKSHYKCNSCGDRYTKEEPMDPRYPPLVGWEFYAMITLMIAVLIVCIYFYQDYA